VLKEAIGPLMGFELSPDKHPYLWVRSDYVLFKLQTFIW